MDQNAKPLFLIHRRRLLQAAGTIGVAAPLAAGLIPNFARAAESPRKGGVVNYLETADPPNFDPFSNTTSAVLSVVAACYNSLIMYNPLKPDEIIGDLAERWEASPDGLSYTFYLIKNAKLERKQRRPKYLAGSQLHWRPLYLQHSAAAIRQHQGSAGVGNVY